MLQCVQFNFTIPQSTPPGKYLMRIENFMPTASTNYLQFYINCALVNIIGPGGGIPTEFVRFPGTYQDEDPGRQEQIAQLHLSMTCC